MTSVKTRQTFELSEDDVKVAVAEYIERKFGADGKLSVSVGVGSVTTGFGMSEHDKHVVSVSASREPAVGGRRRAMQMSADEARADELRLVTNYLHASGAPALREAARELSSLKHRAFSDDPT